jgi:sugar lactone lactonase YvrE
VTLDGTVTTLAGSDGTIHGHKDGYRTNALFSHPTDICSGPDGSLYVTDLENRRIRKIDPTGFVSTIAGNNCSDYCDYDGIGIEAQFSNPTGIAMAEDGTFYIADGTKVRKMTPDGQVSTIAGRRDPGKA